MDLLAVVCPPVTPTTNTGTSYGRYDGKLSARPHPLAAAYPCCGPLTSLRAEGGLHGCAFAPAQGRARPSLPASTARTGAGLIHPAGLTGKARAHLEAA